MSSSPSSKAAIDAALAAAPGEAYAAQRAHGFRSLRFAPRLESEYLAHMRVEQRKSTLICTAAGLAIWLGFSALDLTRLDLFAEFAARHRDAILVAGLRLVTLLVLIVQFALVARPPAPRFYSRISALALLLIGTTAVISVNFYRSRGLPHAYMSEFAIIMAVFLPVGLTFYQSMAIALIIAALPLVTGIVGSDPAVLPELLRLSAMLLLAASVGAVGAYLRELAQRDQFLLQRLLHHHAMHDPLTGIGNRRYFEQQATKALAQARRGGIPVVLGILDVDHFKRFNDRYGHFAGDLALKQVADAIRACLRRPMDLAGRIGGEEFGILIYAASPEDAQIILDRIVSTISGLGIAHDASATAEHLTISIGAACFDGRETLEDLYRRADAALYDAKTAGRNRVGFDKLQAAVTLASRKPQLQRLRS